MRSRTWRGLALLALLAGFSWFGARDRVEQNSRPFDDLDTRLNYALWNFSAEMLDDNGALNLLMEAPIMRNNADSGIGTVENPRIRIQLDEDEWYITADSAIVTADREFVSLVGKVDFLRENRMNGETLEIRTRDVMLNVTPRTANTDAEVTIAQNDDLIDAVGMKLDMKTDSYELLEKVRGRYATP